MSQKATSPEDHVYIFDVSHLPEIYRKGVLHSYAHINYVIVYSGINELFYLVCHEKPEEGDAAIWLTEDNWHQFQLTGQLTMKERLNFLYLLGTQTNE